jgi:nucleoside-diphosphate-sugar epimerase
VTFSSTSVLTKTQSGDAYEQEVVAKLAAGEQRIHAFCANAGIGWTILRPTLIYDEGRDQNVTQIMRTIRRLGFFPIAGKADGRRRPVHARDLAAAALLAVQSPAAANKAYNLSGGETLTYRDMIARVFRSMGRPPLIIPLPRFVWRLAFGALALVRKGGKNTSNMEMALRMSQHMDFDHDAATRDFGYAPGPFAPKFK